MDNDILGHVDALPQLLPLYTPGTGTEMLSQKRNCLLNVCLTCIVYCRRHSLTACGWVRLISQEVMSSPKVLS